MDDSILYHDVFGVQHVSFSKLVLEPRVKLV